MKTILALLFATTHYRRHRRRGGTPYAPADNAGGQVYRLVGFDTPESGDRARCPAERELAARATARLLELVTNGKTELKRVACACRPGTEGTVSCNYSRLCAVLTTDGRDVGELLIGEGLAHKYVCGSMSCPRRASWCD